ncbi:MAG: hypothetical protein ABF969_11995 [Sporolactobacillus sp.]
MIRAEQLMLGVIQVTGDGPIATQTDIDAWHREWNVRIGLNPDGTKKETMPV